MAVALAAGPVAAQHTLTIYVEEARPNGHVFCSLSDGVETVTRGFYSQDKRFALAGKGGGIVKDDSRSPWTVKRVFDISEERYCDAVAAMDAWATEGKAWWVNHHCGDYVEGIARAAKLKVDLPWGFTGRNRPGVFADWLRKHGGVENPSRPSAPSSGGWVVYSVGNWLHIGPYGEFTTPTPCRDVIWGGSSSDIIAKKRVIGEAYPTYGFALKDLCGEIQSARIDRIPANRPNRAVSGTVRGRRYFIHIVRPVSLQPARYDRNSYSADEEARQLRRMGVSVAPAK